MKFCQNSVVLGLVLAVCSINAFAVGESAGDLSSQMAVKSQEVDALILNKQANNQVGTYGNIDLNSKTGQIVVYGQQIFDGGFSGVRSDGINPLYKISSGDQVILRMWGAVEADRVLPVDSQGNVFIPTIGPVFVAGLTQSQMDATLRSAVKNIYPENVDVYTQLQGVQPVAVFVTGFVEKPGRYAGTPNDSLLYFLNQAEGINKSTGSYRVIEVRRNGKVIAEADLYEFLTQAKLPNVQFQDGDTIFVASRGATVFAQTLNSSVMAYELAGEEESGSDFLHYSPLSANISHVLIKGSRDSKPIAEYLSLQAFNDFELLKDDQLSFVADEKSMQIMVQVEGAFLGKSHFILPKNASLQELLANISVDKQLTDTSSVSLRRKSIQEQQRASLLASLQRLENTYLTASSSTSEEAAIRVQEAKLIQDFVARASKIEPNGRLVVATEGGVSDVRLQDGDVITLPPMADSILTSGQVLVPRSIVYQEGVSIQDYIATSGGFTEQADPEKIVIIRQSGEVIADANAVVKPGDEILVLPEVPTKNIQLAQSISQIVYQIAIAAKVALNL